jgi:hypothetical protein
MYNLRTSKLRLITRKGISDSPATNGRFVAWSTIRSGSYTGPVVLLDLKTGRRIMASGSCSNSNPGVCRRKGIDNTVGPPVMSSDLLVWASQEVGRLYARDLATGKEYLVQNDVTGPHDIGDANDLGEPSGHMLVWQDQQMPPRFGIATVP